MSLDQQWCPTSVQVTVLQARGLRTKGKSGTNDAYAVMQVGKEKYQTSVVEKSVAPVWKEEAAFDLPPLHLGGGGGGGRGRGGGGGGELHVHVLHRALVGPDKQLGQAVIDLLQLSEDKTRNKTEWFKLLDKTGKADKDRGEVLLDIQFMRNNMTASMFDLSAAGKSRSRLGKLKDKVRGKKKESDTVSSVVPSFSQVLTDSEDEANGEVAAGKDEKKKKNKMKSLFSPKSNLQKNMSQSMSILPGKNSSLSGSQSSGLNVDSSEGKKKFKFMIHKRSGSSDSKDSSSGHQKHGDVEQSNVCINGSHVYCEEPPSRTSRIGSNFSLASSGHGSMEDVPESSPPSVDSLRAMRQYSPWTEEEEEMAEVENTSEDVDELRREEEERIRIEEERRRKEEEEERERREEEERERLAEERRRLEEQERMRIEEEEKRQREERIREEEEEERRRKEEEEERRQKEALERLAEEKRRQEEEDRKRIEEEKERIQREEERKRWEEQERVKREEEEREGLAEEKRRLEEQERRRIEEEEKRQREEQERIRVEEERAREERRRQEEEERVRRQEEHKLAEEKRRLEEERRIEEAKVRKEEEERIRREEERAQEERRKEEEERVRREEEEHEKKRRLEEQERRQREEKERIRKEEERKREEARKEKEEYERMVEEKRKLEEKERERIETEEKIRREEKERIRMEEERRKEEEAERVRREEEECEEKRRLEEQERKRIEEERHREEEERIRKENEEYERLAEEKRRLEEEERRQKEEEERIREEEEERIRIEEEKRRKEEEERRQKEEEERIREEEEERIRIEEEKRRKEEEERRQKEEEERIREEEEERIRIEEEKRRKEEEERARKEKEEMERLLEEKRRLEEERRQEEERIREEEEERIRIEEERRRQEEEERAKKEKEEMERSAEEKRRLEEQEKRKIEEEERIRRVEKAERERKEEETKKLEKEKLARDAEEQKKRENKTKAARQKLEVAVESPAHSTSTNPFDEDFSNNPFDEIPNSPTGPDSSTARVVSDIQQGCQSAVLSVRSKTVSTEEKDLISTQREKRPAPQPPGRNQAESQREQDVATRHQAQINKQSNDKDIKTASVLPQRWTQMTSPLSQSPTDTKNTQSMMQSSSTKGTQSAAKHSKRPAPPRPRSVEEEPSSEPKTGNISQRGGSETKQVPVVYGLNPFEDDEDELTAQDDTKTPGNTGSIPWPPAVSPAADKDAASQAKLKSSKVAHAPPPPAKKAATSSTLINQNTDVMDDAGAVVPDNGANETCDPQPEAIISVPDQGTSVKEPQPARVQELPPTTSRRLQPVKPLNPPNQQTVSIVQGEKYNQSTGILSEVQERAKVNDTGLKGPYSQLTREELISLVLKQEKQLSERDKKISELEQYIDNLLVRVMEEKPSILMSMNSLKKAV